MSHCNICGKIINTTDSLIVFCDDCLKANSKFIAKIDDDDNNYINKSFVKYTVPSEISFYYNNEYIIFKGSEIFELLKRIREEIKQ